jgi:hypothetical protein
VLVALLGAAAKHSQFDSPPHAGYLSKAVKMAGTRTSSIQVDSAQSIATPVAHGIPEATESTRISAPFVIEWRPLALLSPPLRV